MTNLRIMTVLKFVSQKRAKLAMTEISVETSLLDMPYEILFEIFSTLSTPRLIEISRLCSKFRDVAKDKRLWKNVIVSYDSAKFAFEELYSEPWPVEAMDLLQAHINPPVYSKTDPLIKVQKLYLSLTKANKVTMEAILAKYQCTELYLDCTNVDVRSQIKRLAPKAFSKQKTLKVLTLRDTNCVIKWNRINLTRCRIQLASVLSNCRNLEALNLSHVCFNSRDLLDFVHNLPVSLEKLFLGYTFWVEDTYMTEFFESLVTSTPNLRELELYQRAVLCPVLQEFQFLEALYVVTFCSLDESTDLSMYLQMLPALRTVTVYISDDYRSIYYLNPNLDQLRRTLKPCDITVKQTRHPEWWPGFLEDSLWKVSKAT